MFQLGIPRPNAVRLRCGDADRSRSFLRRSLTRIALCSHVGDLHEEVRFAKDSLLEEAGFEPLVYRQREKGPSLDAVLSLAGLLIFRAPRNCLGGARHGCDLGFGSGIAQGYATLGQIGFSERSGYTAIGTVCHLAARLCADGQGLTDPGQQPHR